MGSDTHEALTQLLQKYLSPINAKGILSRALSEFQLSSERLGKADLPRVIGRIEPSVKLFISASEFATFQRAAREMQGEAPTSAVRRIPVTHERDMAEYASRIVSFRDGLIESDERRNADGAPWGQSAAVQASARVGARS